MRELTRKINEHINSVRRELKHLVELGLLTEIEHDRKKYYQVNTEFVMYPELKGLILKAMLPMEREFIAQLQKSGKIKYMAVLGYFVDDPEAEIDLFIVGTPPKKQLKAMLVSFNEQFGHELRFTIMSPKEYTYRKEVTDKFLFSILNSPQVAVIDQLHSRHA